MRISDWSSDVCSSDLRRIVDNVADPDILQIADHLKIAADYPVIQVFLPFNHGKLHFRRSVDRLAVADDVDEIYRDILDPGIEAHRNPRSEEHTSELQSLMRISYAVFCLKKKKKHRQKIKQRKEKQQAQL